MKWEVVVMGFRDVEMYRATFYSVKAAETFAKAAVHGVDVAQAYVTSLGDVYSRFYLDGFGKAFKVE
jgi:hypothetical protein